MTDALGARYYPTFLCPGCFILGRGCEIFTGLEPQRALIIQHHLSLLPAEPLSHLWKNILPRDTDIQGRQRTMSKWMSTLSYYFFFASKTIPHVINDCAEQSTPARIQYRNSYTVNFWRFVYWTPLLGEELCSFVSNCSLLREAPCPEPGWWQAPHPFIPVCVSLPVANRSFLPRCGSVSSKAHLENTNVHLTMERSRCGVLFVS